MANNQITFGVGFQVDKSGLNQLKTSLNEISKMTTKDFMKINPESDIKQVNRELINIRTTAETVELALNKAFNQKLNTVNIQAFNKTLKDSGMNIQQIYTTFSKAGVSGQNAFRQLAMSTTGVNLQLKTTKTIVDKMAETLGNTIKWNIASSAINALTGSVQQAFGFVKNLDTSLNDIRIVTEKSADQMKIFSENANTAAKALGQSTRNYTDAALIYYQQGKGDTESQRLAEITLKAANVTGQTGAEVSEQLTAIWNGYKVSAAEAELYIDKVAAVAAATAADLEELSTGMSKVASAANTMGVDVDQLNAQLATIVSVTRQAPESVGTALKTIYARMTDLKLGGTDEDGMGLGKVSGQLADVGIQILDESGNLRNLGTVIEEVAAKWNTWNEAQRTAIAQVMAGTRQYNNLVALFDSWDMYTDALETSKNAAGTLNKQQEIYMDSTRAHLQQLSTAQEDLYKSLLDTDTINTVADIFRELIELTTTWVDGLGGGIGLLSNIGALIPKIFSKQIAKGINNRINDRARGKENQQQIDSALNQIDQYQSLENLPPATQDLLNQRKQIYQMAEYMKPEDINKISDKIGSLVPDANKLAELEKFKKTYDQIVSKTIKSQNFDLIEEEEADQLILVDNYLLKLQTDFNSVQDAFKEGVEVEDFETLSTTTLPQLQQHLEQLKNVGLIDTQSFDTITAAIEEYTNLLALKQSAEEQGWSLGDLGYDEARLEQLQTQIMGRMQQIGGGVNLLTQQVSTEINAILNDTSLSLDGQIGAIQERLANASQEVRETIMSASREQLTEGITSLVGNFTSLYMAMQNIANLDDIWGDNNLTTTEKMSQTITTLAFSMPMLVSSFSALAPAIEKIKQGYAGYTAAIRAAADAAAAENVQLTIGAKLKALITKINPWVAGIAALTVALALLNKYVNHLKEVREQRIKATQENIDELKEYDKERKAIDSLYVAYQNAYTIYQQTGSGKDQLKDATLKLSEALGIEISQLDLLADSYDNVNRKIAEASVNKAKEAYENAQIEKTKADQLILDTARADYKKTASQYSWKVKNIPGSNEAEIVNEFSARFEELLPEYLRDKAGLVKSAGAENFIIDESVSAEEYSLIIQALDTLFTEQRNNELLKDFIQEDVLSEKGIYAQIKKYLPLIQQSKDASTNLDDSALSFALKQIELESLSDINGISLAEITTQEQYDQFAQGFIEKITEILNTIYGQEGIPEGLDPTTLANEYLLKFDVSKIFAQTSQATKEAADKFTNFTQDEMKSLISDWQEEYDLDVILSILAEVDEDASDAEINAYLAAKQAKLDANALQVNLSTISDVRKEFKSKGSLDGLDEKELAAWEQYASNTFFEDGSSLLDKWKASEFKSSQERQKILDEQWTLEFNAHIQSLEKQRLALQAEYDALGESAERNSEMVFQALYDQSPTEDNPLNISSWADIEEWKRFYDIVNAESTDQSVLSEEFFEKAERYQDFITKIQEWADSAEAVKNGSTDEYDLKNAALYDAYTDYLEQEAARQSMVDQGLILNDEAIISTEDMEVANATLARTLIKEADTVAELDDILKTYDITVEGAATAEELRAMALDQVIDKELQAMGVTREHLNVLKELKNFQSDEEALQYLKFNQGAQSLESLIPNKESVDFSELTSEEILLNYGDTITKLQETLTSMFGLEALPDSAVAALFDPDNLAAMQEGLAGNADILSTILTIIAQLAGVELDVSALDALTKNLVKDKADTYNEIQATYRDDEGNIAEEDRDDYAKAMDKLSEEKAEAVGFDKESLDAYADGLETVIGSTTDFGKSIEEREANLKHFAAECLEVGDALDDLRDLLEENADVLKDESKKGTNEYIKALGELSKATEQLLGTEMDEDFLLENLDLIQEAANGSGEALEQLRKNAAAEIITNIATNFEDDAEIQDKLTALNSLIQNANLADLKIGATLEDAGLQAAFNEMLTSGQFTADQLNAILASIGFEPTIGEALIPVDDQAVSEIKTTGYAIDFNGMPYEVNASALTEIDGQSYVKIPTINGKGPKYVGSGSSSGQRKKSGGGGGGGQPQKPNVKKPKEERIDPYHNVNIRLEKLNDNLEDLTKQQDKLMGKELLDNLNAQLEVLEKQKNTLQEKMQIAQMEAKYYQEILEDEGAIIGPDGQIENYQELMEAKQAELNSVIAKYNQMSASEQEKFEDDVEKAEEDYEKFKENLEIYEETINDIIPEIEDQLQEAMDQAVELEITKFKLAIDVRLDMSEAERDWNEFKSRVISSVDDDDFLGNAQHKLEDLISYYNTAGTGTGSIQSLTSQINDTIAQLNMLNDVGWASIYGDNHAQALEDLQEYTKELQDQLMDIQDLVDEINEAYYDTIDAVKDDFDKQIDSYEHISDLIEHDMEVIQLLYGEDEYEAMEAFYEKQAANNLSQLESLRMQAQYWKEQMEQSDPDSEEWTMFKENYDEAIADLNSTLEDSLDNIINKYTNTINSIFSQLNNKITSGFGLDYVGEEWDLMNENADQYLDTINAMYAIQDTELAFKNAIKDSDSISTQQRLNDLMERELKYLREKDKLTQYDVDRANMMLDLELKRIALEEAQQNKTKLRLRRDSQGNYSYQYVSDADAVAQAQEELLAAQNELYNFDKNRYQENLDQMYSTYQEFQEKLLELYEDQTLSDEERDRKKMLLVQQYGELINGITQENISIRENLEESAFTEMAALYNGNVEDFQAMTDKQKEIFMSDLIPAWIGGVQKMTDVFASEDGFVSTCIQAFEKLDAAFGKYKTEVEDIENAGGLDTDELQQGIDGVIDYTSGWITANDELITTAEEQLTAIQNLIAELALLQAQYKAVSDAAIEAAKAGHSVWQQDQDQNADDYEAAEAWGNSEEAVKMNSELTSDDVRVVTGKTYDDGSKSWAIFANDDNRMLGAGLIDDEDNVDVRQALSGVTDKLIEEWLRHAEAFETGGYTGEWAPNGKVAILHEKELILNQTDTKNILSAVDMVRQITANVASNMGARLANMMGSIGSTFSAGDVTNNETIEQSVHIEANFPNATSTNEIQSALENLVNIAAQRAMSQRR